MSWKSTEQPKKAREYNRSVARSRRSRHRAKLLSGLVLLVSILGAGAPAGGDERLEAAQEAYGSGEFARAYKLAGKVLKKEPDNALAHYIAGAAGLMLDETKTGSEGAEAHLGRALELEPRIPGAHYLLGYQLYRRARELDEIDNSEEASPIHTRAAEHFEAELEISPGYLKAVEGLALSLAGIPEPERAIEAHEAWIAAAPESGAAHASLARVLVESGRFMEAVAQLDRFPPGSPEAELSASFELAIKLSRNGDKDLASKALRALSERSTEDWYHYALRFLELLGLKRPEAVDELSAFADRGPPVAAKAAMIDMFMSARRLSLEEAMRRGAEFVAPPFDGTIPQRIAYREPVYPELAKLAKIESRVRALCVVSREGTARVIIVMSDRPDLGFEEAATRAIEQWRYRPVLHDGEPVDSFISVIVDFYLD